MIQNENTINHEDDIKKQFVSMEDDGIGQRQTPHAGRHFLPSHPAFDQPWIRRWYWKLRHRKRFTEGWYYRLTLVEEKISFAFIISIEDPGFIPQSDLRLTCIQIIGPRDEYLVQADQDDTKFWAYTNNQQALGCTFQYNGSIEDEHYKLRTALSTQEWKQVVKSGFQILPKHLLGRIHGHDGTNGGVLDGQGIPGTCDFNIVVDPICGWGGRINNDNNNEKTTKSQPQPQRQKSTGGWLSNLAVFEPHWQVTMADARATGTVTWKNTTYTFEKEPFYAEKNWGAALPTKWYWTQCNAFEGYEQLSVTAGGGIRKVPLGQQEALGMVSVHYNGTFYEAVPWTGSMEWNVQTWGYWQLRGTCTTGSRPFEVEVTYQCDPQQVPGLVFRAPTPNDGMVYFCRDTFDATTNLTLWELEYNSMTKEYVRKVGQPPLIDNAHSVQGGAEIGGGPWWDSWIATSQLKRTISILLTIPYRIRNLKNKVRQFVTGSK